MRTPTTLDRMSARSFAEHPEAALREGAVAEFFAGMGLTHKPAA
jgi:hypothetical protein